MLKNTKLFREPLGTAIGDYSTFVNQSYHPMGAYPAGSVTLTPGNPNATYVAEDPTLSNAVKFGFSKSINSNYLTFSVINKDVAVSSFAQLLNITSPKDIGTNSYTFSVRSGEDLVLLVGLGQKIPNKVPPTYNFNKLIASSSAIPDISGVVSLGCISNTLNPQEYKVWRMVVPAKQVILLQGASLSLGFASDTNTYDPVVNMSLIDFGVDGSIISGNTLVSSSDYPNNTYPSSGLVNINVNTTPAPYPFCWQQVQPMGGVKTITTITGGVTNSSLSFGSTPVGSTLKSELVFRNSSTSTYVITKVEFSCLTQSLANVSNTTPDFNRNKVAADFSLSCNSQSLPTLTGATTVTSLNISGTLAPLDMLTVSLNCAPSVKVTPTMISPYNASTSPTTAAGVNANRKAQIKVYGYVQGGNTTPIPLGDALSIKASVI